MQVMQGQRTHHRPTFANGARPARRLVPLVLAACIAVFVSPAARGSIVEYQYQGVITSADPSSGVAVGTPFTGTFSYDKDLAAPWISIEGSNQYFSGYSEPFGGKADASGLSLSVAGQPAWSSPGGIEVAVSQIDFAGQYGYPSSPMSRLNFSNGNVGSPERSVSLTLSNPTSAVLHSLALPGSVNLSDFPIAQLLVTQDPTTPQTKMYLAGRIQSLTEVQVPEPALTTVLSLVAAGWLARRKARAGRGESKVS